MISLINPSLGKVEEGLTNVEAIDLVAVRSVEELRDRLSGIQALLVSNSTYDGMVADILRSAPGLRWIQVTSIGVDALFAHRPPAMAVVTNAAGLKAPTVAEHAMALLLALVRRLPPAINFQRVGQWRQEEMVPELRSLAGMCIVCLGYGAIGREVARKLTAFDARIIAVNRSGKGPPPAERVLPLTSLHQVLPYADAVVVALPLTVETREIIGADELALMQPEALLVNVGRGELIDETALVNALTLGRLGGAGLDVFVNEPLGEDSALWRCPRMILTPHLGGSGGNGDQRLVRLVQENAGRLARGIPLLNVVRFS